MPTRKPPMSMWAEACQILDRAEHLRRQFYRPSRVARNLRRSVLRRTVRERLAAEVPQPDAVAELSSFFEGKRVPLLDCSFVALDGAAPVSATLLCLYNAEPLLAYALNGEPLTREQGFPVRLIMPGWYGVANVKWLAEVHLQEDRYLGNYQARWYRSVVGVGGTGEDNDPETQWVETEVTRMHLKSVIARVRKTRGTHQILGFALNDGTPLRSVEIQIDGGPWSKATLASTNTRYSWKLFTYRWEGATPGEHTLVSRATDVEGTVQPVAAELKRKKTFLQDNAQFPRKVMIS